MPGGETPAGEKKILLCNRVKKTLGIILLLLFPFTWGVAILYITWKKQLILSRRIVFLVVV